VPLAAGPDASLARKVGTLLLGIVLVGTGVALTIRAEIGVAPYDVLTTGLAARAGIAIGIAAVIVPVTFTVTGMALGGRIGPGTAIAAVTVGPVIAATLWVLPEVHLLVVRIPLFAVGGLMLAVGITAVVVADVGPGPAELLMLAVHAKGPPLAATRTGIEVVSVATGWALGGQVGAGTIVVALLIGPLLRRLLDLAGYRGPRTASAEPAGAGP
jgi:uncharacterized membrane protein YczE